MAQQVHKAIRVALTKLIGGESADSVRIIYGGSVNAENCVALAAESDINGFLVGGLFAFSFLVFGISLKRFGQGPA